MIDSVTSYFGKYILHGIDSIFDEYCSNSVIIGKEIRIVGGAETMTGLCEGFSKQGALIVRTAEGIREFLAGGFRFVEWNNILNHKFLLGVFMYSGSITDIKGAIGRPCAGYGRNDRYQRCSCTLKALYAAWTFAAARRVRGKRILWRRRRQYNNARQYCSQAEALLVWRLPTGL